MTTKAQKPFAPWARDMKIGGAVLLLGAAWTYFSVKADELDAARVAAGLVVMAIGGWLLKRGLIRWGGKRLENGAIQLDLPDGWKSTAGRMVHTGGDIDLLLESPAEEKYAIEIKSIHGITVKVPLFFGEPTFSGKNGEPLRVNPVPQTMRNAEAVGAIPVLWLPKGDAATIKLKSGLIIVQGGKTKLLKAVGAKKGWFF
jgi:hypothetical protein